MVRLSIDLIARGASGYTKKKKDEEMDHYLKRLTHLYLEDKSIDEVVRTFTELTYPIKYPEFLKKIGGHCLLYTHLQLGKSTIGYALKTRF